MTNKKENFEEFAKNFAKKAGKIMLKNFQLGMKKEWKKDNSPVTETDLKINSLLIEEVKRNFPGQSVLAEEESFMLEKSDYIWVCDPVDGTFPFSHGIPVATFSLALVKNGEPIIGVVLDPFEGRLFFASKGKGSFLNGKKIHVSNKKSFSNIIGECEVWINSKYNVNDLFLEFIKMDAKITKFISFVYPTALVAAGEYDFSVFPHSTCHDVAAVKIIVEEAGGKTTDIFGNEQRYDREINGFIASNGVLHDKLVELSKKFVKVNSNE